ncbi:MAG: sodium:solute symporter family transporter [Candidatus Zhuqueibacterota bacterium]
MQQNLTTPDLFSLLLYFALLLGIGFYYSRKERNSTDYFLAGKNAGWIAMGASLFIASMSIDYLFGFTGSTENVFAGHFGWMAAFFILMLGWLFAPVYVKMGVFTTPEFLGRRYNRFVRDFSTMFSLLGYVFTRISVLLYAGSMLLNSALGMDPAVSAFILIACAGIYAVTGGLKAILHVDIFQSAVIVLGALALTMWGLPGFTGLSAVTLTASQSLGTLENLQAKPLLSGIGMMFGLPIIGLWYWCTDQYIVQRILGGKNLNHIRSGAILAGFLKLVPMMMLVFPGLIAFDFFNPPAQAPNAASLHAAGQFLPAGIRGLVVASMLSALISSLANSFTSSATLFTMDLYRPARPHSTEKELVLIGRLATVAVILLGIIWVPFLRHIHSGGYLYLLIFQAVMSPPIAAVFVIGLLWTRANATGAVWALVSGAMIALVRLIADLFDAAAGVRIPILHEIADIHVLHFAALLFLISGVVLIVVSVSTQVSPASPAATRDAHAIAGKSMGEANPMWTKLNIGFSIALVLALIGLYGIPKILK